MKRILTVLLAIGMLLSCGSGCGRVEPQDGRPSVVVTVYPVYDWVVNLLGDQLENYQVTLLCDQATDMHSYQPSAADLLTISDADLFVYVGGESDVWVEDALKEAVNRDMVVVNLMEELGELALEEEEVEGMQEARGEEEEGVLDEHIWLSLRNAMALAEPLSQALTQLKPKVAQPLAQAKTVWLDKLQELDDRYGAMVERAPYDTILVADRFPFRYLTADYPRLKYYAAFVGCAAETEASFHTIVFLSEKLEELQLPAVCVLEQPAAGGRLAETIMDTAKVNVTIVTLDSMQCYSPKYAAQGGYLGVMEQNLAGLTEALGGDMEEIKWQYSLAAG